MVELIFLVIFVVSLGGVLFILSKKLPVLNTLPQNGKIDFRNNRHFSKIENKIKSIFLVFEKQILLHKLLSWIKCIILKTEVKIDHLLHNIRKKAQEKRHKN
jgi:hypothetical protein